MNITFPCCVSLVILIPHELEERENAGALIIISHFDKSHICDDNAGALSSNYS